MHVSDGLDILDFYKDRSTRNLYKDHITSMVNRVNVFTGVRYRGESFEAPGSLNVQDSNGW